MSKMKNFIAASAISAAALLGGSSAYATPVVVFSDDFESYTQGAPSSISPKWNVLEGSVDVIGTPGAFPWYPSQQIDMNGSGGESTAARIEAVISGFIVGHTYALSFDYGSNKNSNEDETLLYQIAGLSGSVSTSGPVPNLLNSGKLIFTATAATLSLFFADGQYGLPYDDDNSQGGPILDNVQVSAVPIPAAAPLLMLALGGLAAAARRRKA